MFVKMHFLYILHSLFCVLSLAKPPGGPLQDGLSGRAPGGPQHDGLSGAAGGPQPNGLSALASPSSPAPSGPRVSQVHSVIGHNNSSLETFISK